LRSFAAGLEPKGRHALGGAGLLLGFVAILYFKDARNEYFYGMRFLWLKQGDNHDQKYRQAIM
jgi:hypothetical protein